ncbi:MAG: phosphatidylglycerophosphatase A [Pigmentiphaga sp.]
MTDRSRRYPPPAPLEPSLRWMGARLARIVAFGFGSGLLRPAPGTWGTLAAWLLWWLVVGHAASWGIALILALGFAYGVWACGVVGRELGRPDHGGMVWDEIIAFWLVLWLVPDSLFAQALAFVLFRVFDIRKPWPIRHWERRLHGGLGVMVDDLAAAGYTVLLVWLLSTLF